MGTTDNLSQNQTIRRGVVSKLDSHHMNFLLVSCYFSTIPAHTWPGDYRQSFYNRVMGLEEVFVNVRHQMLIDLAISAAIDKKTFPVTSTSELTLRQINFQFDGRGFRGIQQDPKTKSRWAAMARSNKKAMQFVEGGRSLWWRMENMFLTTRYRDEPLD